MKALAAGEVSPLGQGNLALFRDTPIMKKLLSLTLFFLVGAAVIGLGILVGSNASWYFAWIFGTAFFVLLLAGAVMWFERLDEPRSSEPERHV